MGIERRYPDQYPRPHLPIKSLKITSTMAPADPDYAIIGDHPTRSGFTLNGYALVREGADLSRQTQHVLDLPLTRDDIKYLIAGLTQMLADHDRIIGRRRAS